MCTRELAGRASVLTASAAHARSRLQLRGPVEDPGDRRRRITTLRGGAAAAATRASLTYGRFREGGITFHTIRHTASTILAELGVGEPLRKDLMGHERVETTQWYTHLRPIALVGPAEQLSAALPIADLVTLPGNRPRRSVGENVGPRAGDPSVRTGK